MSFDENSDEPLEKRATPLSEIKDRIVDGVGMAANGVGKVIEGVDKVVEGVDKVVGKAVDGGVQAAGFLEDKVKDAVSDANGAARVALKRTLTWAEAKRAYLTSTTGKATLRKNFVDSTALVVTTLPINVTCDLYWLNQNPQVSYDARIWSAALMYVGIGKKVEDYRKIMHHKFGFTETTNRLYTGVVDGIYYVGTSYVGSCLILGASALLGAVFGGHDTGVHSFGDYFYTAGKLTVPSFPAFFAAGLLRSVDNFRELCGIETDEPHEEPVEKRKRHWGLPSYMRDRLTTPVKRAIAVGLVAASIATTIGLYRGHDVDVRPTDPTEQPIVPVEKAPDIPLIYKNR